MKRQITKIPVLNRAALHAYRAAIAGRMIGEHSLRVARWLFGSREFSNFTYHLTDLNRRQLAHFLSGALDVDVPEVTGYVEEILQDERLRRHIEERTRSSELGWMADREARYGRRVGWYAVVRITKPKVVIETGVDKGLGTCVLAAALLKNREEGFPGKVYGIDVDDRAGWLVSEPYSSVAEILAGDSHQILPRIRTSVDVLIHDSLHTYAHESGEYELVSDLLVPGTVLVSDAAHASAALMDFAEARGWAYYYWQEQPEAHVYEGAGVGLATARGGAGRSEHRRPRV